MFGWLPLETRGRQKLCVLHGLSFDQVAGTLPITAADTIEVPPEQVVAQHLRKAWGL